MKTTFKQYISEGSNLPKAKSIEDLIDSIANGKFTKDGTDLFSNTMGNFICNGKKLESLVGAPQGYVTLFDCDDNKLKNLVGSPPKIKRNFYCSDNSLLSLEGAPKLIGKDFYCDENHLTSLESIHMHIHEIFGEAYFEFNPIKSHVLGLLKIKGLKKVELDNKEVQKIINKYLLDATGKNPSLRDIVDCQEELMDNDLEDYALL